MKINLSKRETLFVSVMLAELLLIIGMGIKVRMQNEILEAQAVVEPTPAKPVAEAPPAEKEEPAKLAAMAPTDAKAPEPEKKAEKKPESATPEKMEEKKQPENEAKTEEKKEENAQAKDKGTAPPRKGNASTKLPANWGNSGIVIKNLDPFPKLKLNDEQSKKLQQLKYKFGPKMFELLKKSEDSLTPAQVEKRNKARKRIETEKLKGSDAKKLMDEALGVPGDHPYYLYREDLTRQGKAVRKVIREMLTEEQLNQLHDE